MFYLVYRIVHVESGKEYIGSHKTKDINDSYMGSGTYLRRARQVYGDGAFRKEIIAVFDNPEEMYAKEAELVNEEYLTTANTYNLKPGGNGGFQFINRSGLNNKDRSATYGFKGKKHSQATRERISKVQTGRQATYGMLGKRQTEEARRKISERNKGKAPSAGMTGRKHSEETRQKIRASVIAKRANSSAA